MSGKKTLAKAPYTRYGDLMDYVGTVEPHEWRDNTPFYALLTLAGSERGMSAARFVWHSNGRIFKMFMTDMVDMIKNTNSAIFKGTVHTWWIAQKRGKNYGIRLARPEELAAAGHLGGNAEDCPSCRGTNPAYPFICPASEASS